MNEIEMMKEARQRLKTLAFGDPVTNVCAGDKNPHKRGYFVSQNREWVICTDKLGDFWKTGVRVVFPGHLDDAKCIELFAPIHAAIYGTTPT